MDKGHLGRISNADSDNADAIDEKAAVLRLELISDDCLKGDKRSSGNRSNGSISEENILVVYYHNHSLTIS